MSEQTESQPVLRRYLTPFYGFTLGLALILASIAIIFRPTVTSEGVNLAQVTPAQTVVPTRSSSQSQTDDTPTPLPSAPPTPDEIIPSPLGVSAGELNGLQVSLWHPWSGVPGAVFQAMLDEFNRSNRWGITANGSGYDGYGRLDEAVEAALNTNEIQDAAASLPDVLVDYSYAARHWDIGRPLVDLHPYVNDPLWGLTDEERADFYPGFWDEDVVPGVSAARRLGIPFFRSAYGLFYNQSWGNELGFPEPPRTAEDFHQQACAAADDVAQREGKSEPRRGGYLVTSQGGAMAGWIYAFGGKMVDPGNENYQFDTPETMAALIFLKDLQESGCAWSETGTSPQSEFASRQALFMLGSLFDTAAQGQAFAQAGSRDRWEMIPFPSRGQPVMVAYGPSLFINTSNPAKQLAGWLVIKWLTEPSNLARWSEELRVYPARMSALEDLDRATLDDPQWFQALELIPEARSEPNLVSWSMMRWVLADAMAQLFEPQFDREQIPAMIANLDQVAAEIVIQVR